MTAVELQQPSQVARPADGEANSLRVLILGLAALTLLLVIVTAVRVLLLPDAAGRQDLIGRTWLAALLYTAIGARVADRHPRNAVPWLMLGIGVSSAVSLFSTTYLDTSAPISWLAQWIWWPGWGLLPLVLLLFPDGRLPSARWRPAAWLAGLGVVVPLLALALAAASHVDLLTRRGVVATVTGLPAVLLLVARFGLLLALGGAVAALTALVVRYRRSQGDERQQLKWLLAAAAIVPVAAALEGLWDPPGVWLVGVVVVPVAIGIAMLKYGLYEIDPIINRSLVYGGLTAAVVGLYVGTVTLLGTLLQRTGLPVALAATGVVAVAFQPIRDRLQRAVNRLMYGDRDDPYLVLSRLGQRLEASLAPEAVFHTMIETVAQALRLPYAAIELRHGQTDETAATIGRLTDQPLRLPLAYQGETIGWLVLGPRAPGETFSPADLRLLTDIARQAGVAAHAVQLTADLQRSRERLVTAREEERRRLRRDLHDGLGAAMAGLVLQLGTAKLLVARDPAAASAMLDKLRSEIQNAITDIRRLVYDLRPPQLDELGLVGALEEHAARLAQSGHGGSPQPGGLTVTVKAPAELPMLPAAVEVAAYRIATEALTNVARHARASSCQVLLEFDGQLKVEVRDDGQGPPRGRRPGVGLTSMRERAAELGGDWVMEPAAGGGTVVRAQLPVQGW